MFSRPRGDVQRGERGESKKGPPPLAEGGGYPQPGREVACLNWKGRPVRSVERIREEVSQTRILAGFVCKRIALHHLSYQKIGKMGVNDGGEPIKKLLIWEGKGASVVQHPIADAKFCVDILGIGGVFF